MSHRMLSATTINYLTVLFYSCNIWSERGFVFASQAQVLLSCIHHRNYIWEEMAPLFSKIIYTHIKNFKIIEGIYHV